MSTTKLIAACIVLSLVGAPALSLAKARGGSGGGYSSGSRSGSSGSMGSRGSRTYQDNGAKPIEQSATTRPSAAPPPSASAGSASTARSAPASQPSWWQRNPLLAGIAGGLAGTWLGHMIFGATDSSARTSENGEPVGNGESAASAGSNSLLFLLMIMGAGALYYFTRGRRTPAPDFSGLSRSSVSSGPLLSGSSAATIQVDPSEFEVTVADKAAFQQLLVDVQTAWSQQDMGGLRRLVTPEMLEYFNIGWAENSSQDVANHVEDVTLLRAEIKEAWSEGATQYATAMLRWSARDYTVSLTKQRGEPGHLVDGSDEQPTETSEVWTFLRHQNGKWLLSAIQQVA